MQCKSSVPLYIRTELQNTVSDSARDSSITELAVQNQFSCDSEDSAGVPVHVPFQSSGCWNRQLNGHFGFLFAKDTLLPEEEVG